MTTIVASVVLRALSDLILPPRCASCDAWGATPLCSGCERRVAWIDREACTRCGAPARTRRSVCRLCSSDGFWFDGAACAAVYDGAVRDAIVAFKLAGERRAAAAFGRWLTLAAGRLARPDAISWVPSTRRTLAARGFDPAGEIALAFSAEVGMRASPLVRKIRETADQHGLGKPERRANLVRAFDVPRDAPPTVLLVDDILTTGATADACAAALKAAGATVVQVLTVARAL